MQQMEMQETLCCTDSSTKATMASSSSAVEKLDSTHLVSLTSSSTTQITSTSNSNRVTSLSVEDARRLCAEQVVVDLASCIKELVENALDAGAKSVHVKLKDMGCESIEVVDDGRGLDTQDRKAACLRHWTSKIASFEDLANVRTLGFRGEALASICDVAASVVICTRIANEEVGTKCEYDRLGLLVKETPIGRAVGTTVSVTGLFERMPVRRKEFKQNLKRHYARALGLLQAYALVAEGVQILITNVESDGKSTKPIVTRGVSFRENVANVFGAKFLEELIEFDARFVLTGKLPHLHKNHASSSSFAATVANTFSFKETDNEELSDEDKADSNSQQQQQPNTQNSTQSSGSLQSESPPMAVRIVGFVSKPRSSGVGKSSTDRQFLFLNGRPVDLKRVSNAINESWRQFDLAHKPAFVLDLKLPPGTYDVNLSPDKREVLIALEREIIDGLRDHLFRVWEPSRYTFQTTPKSAGGSFQGQGSFQKQICSDYEKSNTRKRKERDFKDEEQEKVTMQETSKLNPLLEDDFVITEQNVLGQSDQVQKNKVGSNETSALRATIRGEGEMEGRRAVVQKPKPFAARNTTSLRYVSDDASVDEHVPVSEVQENGVQEVKTRENGEDGSYEEGKTNEAQKEDQKSRANLDSENDLSLSPEANSSSEALEEKKPTKTVPNEVEEIIKDVEDRQDDIHTSLETNGALAEQAFQPTPTKITTTTSRISSKNSPVCEILDNDASQENGNVFATTASSQTNKSLKRARVLDERTSSTLHVGSVRDVLLAAQSMEDRKRKRDMPSLRHSPTQVSSSTLASSHSSTSSSSSSSSHGHDFNAAHLGRESDQAIVAQELEHVFRKQEFENADVLGQFNLGFILARVGDDLFIFDQHACDEKYRFELLQVTTKIHEQKLIVAMHLELTASEAETLRENEDIFAANGFHFIFEEQEDGPKKVLLTHIPHTKSTVFGPDDVRELASMLRDGRHGAAANSVRLPKVYSMFASRACRSAIMIGDHLGLTQMSNVVAHLSHLAHPWNCPHGRPTMRHLARIKDLVSD